MGKQILYHWATREALIVILICISVMTKDVGHILMCLLSVYLFRNVYWNSLPILRFSSVQSLSCVQLFVTTWTAAHQAFLSITNSQSLLNLWAKAFRHLKKTCARHRTLFWGSTFPGWIGDDITNHPNISSSVTPFSSCSQSFPASGSFQWVSSSHQVAKVLVFQLQHQSFQWIFRTNFLEDWLVWSLNF